MTIPDSKKKVKYQINLYIDQNCGLISAQLRVFVLTVPVLLCIKDSTSFELI